ncbi:MAG: S41 family peptidase [Bdellovibrionia bacterium]
MNRTKLFRYIIFVLFTATFIMASSAQEDVPLGEFWKQSGIKVRLLDKVVTDRYCRQDRKAFLGCVGALDALLPAGQRLRPASVVTNKALVLKDFGSVVIAKNERKPMASPAEMVRELKRARAAEEKEWLNLWRYHRFYFEGLLAAFKPFVEGTPLEAERTARAYNAFLEFFYDPHSYIIPSAFVQKESERSRESFIGIGIQLARLGEYPLVQTVIDDGPAQRAGLKRHDLILRIDGVETSALSLDEAAKKLKGAAGSKIELGLWRGDREITLTVERSTLTRENVESRILKSGSLEFLYIRIASFMRQGLCRDLRDFIAAAPAASGVILDLRNNGGGLLDAAVCTVSAFVAAGKTVVTVKDFDEDNSDSLVTYGGPATQAPLVVLMNSDSASASEIVAGALQDHGRAWVVGERSWGKGTVQQSEAWAWNNRILLFRTIARYYLPSGRSIQLAGVPPDVPVLDDPASIREQDLGGSLIPAEGKIRRRELSTELQRCLAQKRESMPNENQLGVAEGLLACAAGD